MRKEHRRRFVEFQCFQNECVRINANERWTLFEGDKERVNFIGDRYRFGIGPAVAIERQGRRKREQRCGIRHLLRLADGDFREALIVVPLVIDGKFRKAGVVEPLVKESFLAFSGNVLDGSHEVVGFNDLVLMSCRVGIDRAPKHVISKFIAQHM